jgi:hypothetical protein
MWWTKFAVSFGRVTRKGQQLLPLSGNCFRQVTRRYCSRPFSQSSPKFAQISTSELRRTLRPGGIPTNPFSQLRVPARMNSTGQPATSHSFQFQNIQVSLLTFANHGQKIPRNRFAKCNSHRGTGSANSLRRFGRVLELAAARPHTSYPNSVRPILSLNGSSISQ